MAKRRRVGVRRGRLLKGEVCLAASLLALALGDGELSAWLLMVEGRVSSN